MTCARCGSEGFGCYECTPDPFAIIARLTADRDAALAQVSAWRPIETAPMDGTIVDLWGINHLHYAKRQERICNVHYGPVTDWMGHERNDWRHGRSEDFEPTHWMPLPAPPVDSSAAPSTPRLDNRRKAAILAAAEQEEQEE